MITVHIWDEDHKEEHIREMIDVTYNHDDGSISFTDIDFDGSEALGCISDTNGIAVVKNRDGNIIARFELKNSDKERVK